MEEEERGIGVVWQDIFALEEEQGVVHDIDRVLLATITYVPSTLEY